MSRKLFIMFLAFGLTPFFPGIANVRDMKIEITPEGVYQQSFEMGIRQMQQAYLNLPLYNVTFQDIRAFEKEVMQLDKIVTSIRLADFSLDELTRPLNLLKQELKVLPLKEKYTSADLAKIRKWSRYLLREPLVHAFLAKDNVIQGKLAFDEKNYEKAQRFFNQALEHLSVVRENRDSRLKKPLSRIHSEITIFQDAARREKFLSEKRERNLWSQLKASFQTYHENVFDMWSVPAPWERR